MKLRPPHWLMLAALTLTGLGGWLWFRNGVPIWIQDAVAFCF